MSKDAVFARHASPNEQRTISREDLGFYNAVIVGAIYQIEDSVNIDSPSCIYEPLRRCIEEHAFLNVTVGDRHTDKAYFQRVPEINLQEHVEVLPRLSREDLHQRDAFRKVLEDNVDRPFPHHIPHWRVVVLPIDYEQYFMAFAYSHMIGDGPSGLAFHRSFLKAIRKGASLQQSVSALVQTPAQPLPLPFDTPQRLTITWSFLLRPLLGAILPAFVAKAFGLKAQVSTIDEGTWTGSLSSFDPDATRSRILLRSIEAAALQKILQLSREHGSKFTATMHQFTVRALSQALNDPKITNFVSVTAINMRKSSGVQDNEMGEFASGCISNHPRSDTSGPLSSREWASARASTEDFAKAAATLIDQPIGLLRYVPSIRKWTSAKLGQQRDSSYEISNLGVFDEGQVVGASRAIISHTIFTQPGHVTSSPLCFNFSTVKGGSMSYTVSWPAGALGMEGEDEFVTKVCELIEAEVNSLS